MSQIHPNAEEKIVLKNAEDYKIAVGVVVLDLMVDPAVNQWDSDSTLRTLEARLT